LIYKYLHGKTFFNNFAEKRVEKKNGPTTSAKIEQKVFTENCKEMQN